MSLGRRGFLGLGAAALAAPMLGAEARPRVVVVGGGAGGATAARYIARDSAGAIDVALIEPTKRYYSCFFSNHYLGGLRDMESLGHGYAGLAAAGVNVIHDTAIGIDRDARAVRLASGPAVPYDRLILSPGIDFIEGAVEGWSLAAQSRMPHAWKGGTQTELLRAQVLAMAPGATFVMVVPPDPFRCPPGPYERASVIAHVLTKVNPTAKILIADPKPKFSKQALFEEGWQQYYPNMILRLGPDFGGGNVRVDPERMQVDIDGELVEAGAVNVIPAMTAGRIVLDAGLDENGWAPVVPATLQSRLDPAIHILGDSAAQGDMPKSAFSANSQAKACAMAVRVALLGARAFPPRFASTCWSLITPEDAVKVGGTYAATDAKIAQQDGFISQLGEPSALRRTNYEESLGWYAGITADIFG